MAKARSYTRVAASEAGLARYYATRDTNVYKAWCSPELLGKWYSREPVASISSTGNEQVEECACGDVMLLLRVEMIHPDM